MRKQLLLVAASLALWTGRAEAQDVAERGRVHGTPLPPAAREQLARDPNAYEFERALKSELVEVRAARARLRARGMNPQLLPARQAAAQGVAVQGTYRVPVFTLLYANSGAEPYASSELQKKLYTGPSSTLTLTQLYTEMSRGLVTLTGTVHDWIRVSQNDVVYEGSDNGLKAGLLGPLLKEVLDQADKTVDFRQFDADGDGYVDFVGFVHPEKGGECGPTSTNRNVWSHRWTYAGATGGKEAYYQTNDGVRISDYVIQPAYNCDGTSTVDIGVFGHEFGHAFGLPDLYSTSSANDGVGVWGLMGSGNYNQSTSPAHMEAWSKVELGWMPVTTLSRSTSGVRIDPAETTGAAVRIDIPPAAGSSTPSGEYFLLENRQRIGSDRYLRASGLLIWHVDSIQIANTRRANNVQNTTARKGLDLEEADGRADLDRVAARGDDGDPFPGSSGNRSFSATTNPNSNSNKGYSSGVSITGITETVGGPVTLNLEIGSGGTVLTYWGDVNNDGYISTVDVDLLMREAIGRPSGAASLPRGDVDGDGRIDSRDVLILQSYIDGVDVSRYRVGKPTTAAGAASAQRAPVRTEPVRAPANLIPGARP